MGTAGCVNLFDDWYKIARALALIEDKKDGDDDDEYDVVNVDDAGSQGSNSEILEVQQNNNGYQNQLELQQIGSNSPGVVGLGYHGSPMSVVVRPEAAESDIQSVQSYGVISYGNEPKKITISNVPDLPLIDEFDDDEGGVTVNTGNEEPVVPM